MGEIEEEFSNIVREILKPEMTAKELEIVAERWALLVIKIHKLNGIDLALNRPSIDELKTIHREKIINMRSRVGLRIPEG